MAQFHKMLKSYYLSPDLEAGADEAGRGCLAGPVTAAAIILPEDFDNDVLNDSKQLSEKTRIKLKPVLENSAVTFSVVHLEARVVDELNILNASIRAMQECVLNLSVQPKSIIIDGNSPFIPKRGVKQRVERTFSAEEISLLNRIPSSSIIKGDSIYRSIAAASVLAKTYRDDYMDRIHEEFPMYNWKKNKGYPTKEHREAIRKYGVTKYHRMSFRLLPEQYELEF